MLGIAPRYLNALGPLARHSARTRWPCGQAPGRNSDRPANPAAGRNAGKTSTPRSPPGRSSSTETWPAPGGPPAVLAAAEGPAAKALRRGDQSRRQALAPASAPAGSRRNPFRPQARVPIRRSDFLHNRDVPSPYPPLFLHLVMALRWGRGVRGGYCPTVGAKLKLAQRNGAVPCGTAPSCTLVNQRFYFTPASGFPTLAARWSTVDDLFTALPGP